MTAWAARWRWFRPTGSIRAHDFARSEHESLEPLPHLHPEIADCSKSARAAGLEYSELLGALVFSASARWRI